MRLRVVRQCPACRGPVDLHDADGCTAPQCGGNCACAPIDHVPGASLDPDAAVYLELYGHRPGQYSTGGWSTEVQDRGDDEAYLTLAAVRWQTEARPPFPAGRRTLALVDAG